MLYRILPYLIFKKLFGDRRTFGLEIDYEDADWKDWIQSSFEFYNATQKGTGAYVNHMGFKIARGIDLSQRVVLEIDPGIIEHLQYNHSRPQKYILADIREDFLKISVERLQNDYGPLNIESLVVDKDKLPLMNNSVDIIFSFHQLEHVKEIESYVLELKRILKPGGLIVGAVPTEGSLAWGLGRYLTSRRYVRKRFKYNYDKIICWEHPTFVTNIIEHLNRNFIKVKCRKKPFGFMPLDFNLSYSFIFRKR